MLVILDDDQFVPIVDQGAGLLDGPGAAAARIVEHNAIAVVLEGQTDGGRRYGIQSQEGSLTATGALSPGRSPGPRRVEAAVDGGRRCGEPGLPSHDRGRRPATDGEGDNTAVIPHQDAVTL